MNKKYILAIRSAKKQLLSICDTKEQSIKEVHRYKRTFPFEIDYNIAMYGNVLVYYTQVREWFEKLHFKSVDKMSDKALWSWYKWYIGRAADEL